jgi:hypothetical protein
LILKIPQIMIFAARSEGDNKYERTKENQGVDGDAGIGKPY